MITVKGLLLGFAATALASYLAFSGQQVAALRDIAGRRLLDQRMSVIGGFAVILAVLVLRKILDRDGTSAEGVRWLAEGALIFAAMRLARLTSSYLSGVRAEIQ